MSLAACDERCARLRTSEATTAKPRPASPARAASTAALSASRLVWRAISSITPMMSEILRDDSSILAMASTALATTWPPRSATSRVVLARLIGLLGVFGVLLHGRRHLLHRGRGLFQAGGLLLGALRQIGGAGRDLGRGIGDLAARGLDLADGRADFFGHLGHGAGDLPDLVPAAACRHRYSKVAACDVLQRADERPQRTGYTLLDSNEEDQHAKDRRRGEKHDAQFNPPICSVFRIRRPR